MMKLIFCFLVVGVLYAFSPMEVSAQEGCKGYLGREKEKLCTAKPAFDECVVLLKQGKLNLCVLASDPNSRIERKTPAEAEASLLAKGCLKVGANSFNCGSGNDVNSKAAYNVCIGYMNFGSVGRCLRGEKLDLKISNGGAGEFKEFSKSLSSNLTKVQMSLNNVPAGTQKIVWKLTNKSSIDTAAWQNPAGVIASGEVVPTAGTTIFNIDITGAVGKPLNPPRTLFIHAFAVRNDSLTAVPDHVSFTHVGSSGPIKIETSPTPTNTTPAVFSSVEVVDYKPPIFNSDTCAFILTKQPPNGEFKLVLEKIGVKVVGTKFRLCEDNIEKIKKSFSFSEKALLALQDLLQALKKGFNYFNSKYNFLEKKFVDSLQPFIGTAAALKLVNAVKITYGYNPYYGDFDQSIDSGKEVLKRLITDNLPEDADKDKGTASAAVDKFAADVKFYANGGEDPNVFFRADPQEQQRNAVINLRVTYKGTNNPPAKMKGGMRKVTIEVLSGSYKDKNSPGLPAYPPIRLFVKTIELPNSNAGDSFDLPIYLDYAPTRKNEPLLWGNGYNSTEAATIVVDNKKVKVMAQTEFKK